MKYIFLSPHFDDAVYSCGGLIWEMVNSEVDVEVWTVCAGLPAGEEISEYAQEMHDRWGLSVEEVVNSRRQEDQAALARLGVTGRYFTTPDAIYRRHPRTGEYLYISDEELFGAIQPGDQENMRRLAIDLANALQGEHVTVVSPLTVGNHVDHVLVRVAAEMLPTQISYYPDYPYTRKYAGVLDRLAPKSYVSVRYQVSDEGLTTWQDSIAVYTSQLSTFWDSEQEMREEILEYYSENQGVMLWEVQSS